MYVRNEIVITGPICKCPEYDLGWSHYYDQDDHIGLEISCNTCGTLLRVPKKEYKARFVLESDRVIPVTKKNNVVPLNLVVDNEKGE